MTSGPIAVADIGSNTVHLLVAMVAPGCIVPLLDESEMVRLGDDVDRLGAIGPDKLSATVTVLRRFRERARRLGAERLHLVATQAVRVAANRDAFLRDVEACVGEPVRVLAPQEEARLAFEAVTWIAGSIGIELPGHEAPFLLVDIGGGSTQLAIGHRAGLVAVESLPVGSGKLTTLYAVDDPPTVAEVEAIVRHVERVCAGLDGRCATGPPLSSAVGVGGTAKAVRRAAARGGQDDMVSVERLRDLIEVARRLPAAVLAARYGLTPGRARLMLAGCILLEHLLTRWRLPGLRIVPVGVRDGTILRVANGRSVEAPLGAQTGEGTWQPTTT